MWALSSPVLLHKMAFQPFWLDLTVHSKTQWCFPFHFLHFRSVNCAGKTFFSVFFYQYFLWIPFLLCFARLAHVFSFSLGFFFDSSLACSSNSQPLTSVKLKKECWNLPIFIAIRKSNCRAYHVARPRNHNFAIV